MVHGYNTSNCMFDPADCLDLCVFTEMLLLKFGVLI